MSTVPEVLAALVALGQVTLSDRQVVNGTDESVGVTKASMLLIGDQDFEIVREFDSLGGVTTTEQYTVPCTITASVPGADQTIADAQAWADYEALETALAAAPQLGLQATFSLQSSFTGPQIFMRKADPDGRQAAIRFGIFVFAAND